MSLVGRRRLVDTTWHLVTRTRALGLDAWHGCDYRLHGPLWARTRDELQASLV